jgi:hypothetical protein
MYRIGHEARMEASARCCRHRKWADKIHALSFRATPQGTQCYHNHLSTIFKCDPRRLFLQGLLSPDYVRRGCPETATPGGTKSPCFVEPARFISSASFLLHCLWLLTISAECWLNRAALSTWGNGKANSCYKTRQLVFLTSSSFLCRHSALRMSPLSSANGFDANPNTGEPSRSSSRRRIARATIYPDANHPSPLRLPVASSERR